MIEEIIKTKLNYASLLCESDPNINLVENYLRDGRLFAYFENQTPLAFIAIKEINDTTLEIKNLLTLENYRGHGYGKALLQYIEKLYQNKTTFLIGTANSSMTNMLIYTKLGYHYSHKIDNFFIDYYPQEIYENGMQATDLLYFIKTVQNQNRVN
ncbi:GNAT family N-acetyltransferase [Faecalibacillus faecis]|uniref:GNAT family N-acetyltransferase n=1 Tax=Faecalibacillus faecis TaxID=1982628 RepID=UPI002F95EC35